MPFACLPAKAPCPSACCVFLSPGTLNTPGSRTFCGSLTCWLDILTADEVDANPVYDVARPPAEKFEVRMVVWSAREMKIMDTGSGCNDLFFSAHLATSDSGGRLLSLKEDTDVHWRATEVRRVALARRARQAGRKH